MSAEIPVNFYAKFPFFFFKFLAKFVFVLFKEIVIIKQLFLSYFLVFTHNFRLESKQKSMFILSFLLMKNFIVYLILNQFMYYSCLLDVKSNLNTINQIKSDRYFFFVKMTIFLIYLRREKERIIT